MPSKARCTFQPPTQAHARLQSARTSKVGGLLQGPHRPSDGAGHPSEAGTGGSARPGSGLSEQRGTGTDGGGGGRGSATAVAVKNRQGHMEAELSSLVQTVQAIAAADAAGQGSGLKPAYRPGCVGR